MKGPESLIQKNIQIQQIKAEFISEKKLTVSILRLDLIHREISGNKLFKLYFFINEAIKSTHKKIITFGGAFSNHLAATAAVCKEYQLSCIGIVNGSKPAKPSHTLNYCEEMGMQLKFISRKEYYVKDQPHFIENLKQVYGDFIMIPEGGCSNEGMDGAALISNYYQQQSFTHICCAVGTGTTLAGLVKSSKQEQKIIGICAAKNIEEIENKINILLGTATKNNYELLQDSHLGGFAKKAPALFDFMNQFFKDHAIPLDFVYTAKMMSGVYDLIHKNYFTKGSKIICIHTGGLQGNLSLPSGTLNF